MSTDRSSNQGPHPFDPWTSTIEEAYALQLAEEARSGSPTPSYAQPLMQWQAAHEVSQLKAKCEQGSGRAVMECIYLCAWHQLAMPEWLSSLFIKRYRQVESAELGSWDEAFGRPHPRVKLANLRRRLKIRWPIRWAVEKLVLEQGAAIGKDLFAQVGEQFAVSATVAEELYRETLRILPLLPEKYAAARRDTRPGKRSKLPGRPKHR